MTTDTITLTVPDPDEVSARFTAECDRVRIMLPDAEIQHIGSTAVRGFPAKDVVDVLIGVPATAVAAAARTLAGAGYDLEGERTGHAWLSAPDRTARRCVLHVVVRDGSQWRDRIAFRDLLRVDGAARSAYLTTKRAAASGTSDWGVYTAAKADTVVRLLAEARRRNTGDT
ncbi:GrpB family protein [Microbacterium gorillae]|uniref:GrpB family protein n=1 Tax=Microbacterium gorillae TaxID=1231063 RepID=UPI0006943EF6|nr:GrpB family protein [Microbacterium gorillae]